MHGVLLERACHSNQPVPSGVPIVEAHAKLPGNIPCLQGLVCLLATRSGLQWVLPPGRRI